MGLLKLIGKILASLKLTVVLLAAAMVVVFVGTLAQTNQGIWSVQKQFFHAAFITWRGIPIFPGGYLLGALMLINLLAAHAMRFKLSWKRAGIFIIHAGLIVLLVGGLLTSLFAVEMQMSITEGESADYAHDIREAELVVIDPSDPKEDRVVPIPANRLHQGAVIRDASLPFEVAVDRYFPNSNILGPAQAGPNMPRLANSGLGAKLVAVEKPEEISLDRPDFPSAFVTLRAGGKPIGTWLVSTMLDRDEVKLGDKTYEIALRFRRYYKPYSVHLIDFTHEIYPGTDTPKNFASRIRLVDARHNEDRETVISMNQPLRYDGETFYQSGFDNRDNKTTILQIVQNPAAWLPYVSCIMIGGGMLIHFSILLVQFLNRRFA